VFTADPGLAPLVFSSRHACPECGFAVPNLEPRLFSFNNPAGACAGCDGLGVQDCFDPQRIIAQPQLSLASGAVRGWDRHNKHYFELLQGLARTAAAAGLRGHHDQPRAALARERVGAGA